MAYVLEGDDDASTGPLAGPFDLLARDLQVGVALMVQQDDEEDARSASEVMNSLVADVQRVMQLDTTRGGLALDTQETSVSPIQVDDGMPILSATVAYRVMYRHRRNDPSIPG